MWRLCCHLLTHMTECMLNVHNTKTSIFDQIIFKIFGLSSIRVVRKYAMKTGPILFFSDRNSLQYGSVTLATRCNAIIVYFMLLQLYYTHWIFLFYVCSFVCFCCLLLYCDGIFSCNLYIVAVVTVRLRVHITCLL